MRPYNASGHFLKSRYHNGYKRRAATPLMPQQANQPLPDGYRLENYRISSVLSCDGFSIVYLAYDDNDHPVAIKEYLPSQLALRKEGDALPSIAEENLATFRYGLKCFFEEGRSLAGLSHPNVVRVLNFFRANETVYMVMRYERGRTLQEHIQARRRGAVKESFIRHVFSLLLNGLREVHSNKLLHLDIKPANIYIRNDGTPLLIDFGAARQTLTQEGMPEPDVYAGLRAARAVQEPRSARAVERLLRDRREHLCLSFGDGAAAGRPAPRKGPLRLGDEAAERQVF